MLIYSLPYVSGVQGEGEGEEMVARGGYLWRDGMVVVTVVRMCEPVFRNLPHSYTWPYKKRSHSYT